MVPLSMSVTPKSRASGTTARPFTTRLRTSAQYMGTGGRHSMMIDEALKVQQMADAQPGGTTSSKVGIPEGGVSAGIPPPRLFKRGHGVTIRFGIATRSSIFAHLRVMSRVDQIHFEYLSFRQSNT